MRLQQFRCVLVVRGAHTVWTSWRTEKTSRSGLKKNPLAVCCLNLVAVHEIAVLRVAAPKTYKSCLRRLPVDC